MFLDGLNLFFFLLALASGGAMFISGGALLVVGAVSFRRGVNSSLNMSVEVVRVAMSSEKRSASEGEEGRKDWREEIGAMEQLLSSLAGMRQKTGLLGKLPPLEIVFEIANPSDSEEIFFFVAFPRRFRDTVEKQLHSFFPTAVVEPSEDYTVFIPNGEVAVSVLGLKGAHALPLRTYEEMDVDPLNEVSNALSKLDTVEEGAALQLVMRAEMGSGWRTKGREIAHTMQQGKQLKDANRGVFGKLVKDLAGALGDAAFGRTPKKPSDESPVSLTPDEQELVKAIERKASKAAFRVNVRLIAQARSSDRADQIVSQMENSFSQFERSDINHFKVLKRIKKKDAAFRYIMRSFHPDTAQLLGVEEIASIFHLPISATKTPRIKWLKAGVSPPPTDIPKEGVIIGVNDYRGVETKIRIADGDRRRHLYTVGQTGTGKSTFLQEMAKQDIRDGKGMCFIDPHGDAIEDILEAVPKERAEDVIHFNPADMERPFGLNMLEYARPEEKTFVINEMINIFDKLYDLKQTGGPMFEQYMRNAMLLVMEHPESGSTLLEIPKVLADAEFRKMKLSHCANPVVSDFWTKEAEKAGGEAALANMVPYITSKLTQFISNDMMRPIISQQKSTIDFRRAMDEGKIVLINLSKGRVGETNSYLLGMVIVGKLLMAALSRVDMPEKDRRDFYLYIDEFQNVTTDSISQILSEARKYRLNLVIAHQFIGQLSESISKAVFGNVGSLAAFRVGPEDADFLEKQFSPIFSASDLVNVDNYHCFCRLLLRGEATRPFNMRTLPPTDGNLERARAIKELSRLKFGRDADRVRREVEERIRA